MLHVQELVQVSEGIGCALQLTSWMCEADVPTFIHSVKTHSHNLRMTTEDTISKVTLGNT